MTYIVTIVQRNADNQTASTNYLFTDKASALEKYHYECYYALNQKLPYALIDVRDERGAVIRMEVIDEEETDNG